MSRERVRAAIRDVVDFPKPGIVFKDITPVLRDPELLTWVVNALADPWKADPPDAVAAIGARGFILGGAVACLLKVGFIPVRKAGKLPADVVTAEYALEYGTATVEMHRDAVEKGQKILLVDDLLATGGTAGAAVSLIETCGAEVAGLEFLIELCFLDGRKAVKGYPVRSLIDVSGNEVTT